MKDKRTVFRVKKQKDSDSRKTDFSVKLKSKDMSKSPKPPLPDQIHKDMKASRNTFNYKKVTQSAPKLIDDKEK